jgi:hypothetical protein
MDHDPSVQKVPGMVGLTGYRVAVERNTDGLKCWESDRRPTPAVRSGVED